MIQNYKCGGLFLPVLVGVCIHMYDGLRYENPA